MPIVKTSCLGVWSLINNRRSMWQGWEIKWPRFITSITVNYAIIAITMQCRFFNWLMRSIELRFCYNAIPVYQSIVSMCVLISTQIGRKYWATDETLDASLCKILPMGEVSEDFWGDCSRIYWTVEMTIKELGHTCRMLSANYTIHFAHYKLCTMQSTQCTIISSKCTLNTKLQCLIVNLFPCRKEAPLHFSKPLCSHISILIMHIYVVIENVK